MSSTLMSSTLWAGNQGAASNVQNADGLQAMCSKQ
jgi:hypothetical protein